MSVPLMIGVVLAGTLLDVLANAYDTSVTVKTPSGAASRSLKSALRVVGLAGMGGFGGYHVLVAYGDGALIAYHGLWAVLGLAATVWFIGQRRYSAPVYPPVQVAKERDAIILGVDEDGPFARLAGTRYPFDHGSVILPKAGARKVDLIEYVPASTSVRLRSTDERVSENRRGEVFEFAPGHFARRRTAGCASPTRERVMIDTTWETRCGIVAVGGPSVDELDCEIRLDTTERSPFLSAASRALRELWRRAQDDGVRLMGGRMASGALFLTAFVTGWIVVAGVALLPAVWAARAAGAWAARPVSESEQPRRAPHLAAINAAGGVLVASAVVATVGLIRLLGGAGGVLGLLDVSAGIVTAAAVGGYAIKDTRCLLGSLRETWSAREHAMDRVSGVTGFRLLEPPTVTVVPHATTGYRGVLTFRLLDGAPYKFRHRLGPIVNVTVHIEKVPQKRC